MNRSGGALVFIHISLALYWMYWAIYTMLIEMIIEMDISGKFHGFEI